MREKSYLICEKISGKKSRNRNNCINESSLSFDIDGLYHLFRDTVICE